MNASRASVYRALVDVRAASTWMVPAGVTGHVHAFEPREGGALRITLTADAPAGADQTTVDIDTLSGRFVTLVTNEQVVQVLEWETTELALRGEMKITITLHDADGGTEVVVVHDNLPPGLPPANNEAGWRSSLAKLAALVEAG